MMMIKQKIFNHSGAPIYQNKRISGVILAGGRSRRMGGGDKCLMPLAGKTLLAHVVARLNPQVANIVLNANGDVDRFADFCLPIIADSFSGFAGPLAGVLAAMEWGRNRRDDFIVTVAADTPFFPKNLLDMLLQGGNFTMAASVDINNKLILHPTFALWPLALRHDLHRALKAGIRKVIAFTQPNGCKPVVFKQDGFNHFFNINTPQDMIRAQDMIRKLQQ